MIARAGLLANPVGQRERSEDAVPQTLPAGAFQRMAVSSDTQIAMRDIENLKSKIRFGQPDEQKSIVIVCRDVVVVDGLREKDFDRKRAVVHADLMIIE